MNATTPARPITPELRAVHIDMARSYRRTAAQLTYTMPGTAQTMRRLMREHALKSRGKIV